MKHLFKVMFLGLLLAGASCTELGPETINEIVDHYTAPENAVILTKLESSESEWKLDKRIFDLSFSGGGASMAATLVGYDALLAPGQYVLTGSEATIGEAMKASVNGKEASSGYITVGKNGSDYMVSAVLDVDNLSHVFSWRGALPFKEDPAPVKLTVVQQAQSNVANGTNSLTLQLATDGISKSYNESWQEVWEGEGGYLALDIYSDDGYLHEGIYTPCAKGGEINAGEFGIGWDPGDLWNIGMSFENWGTCWWAVSGGAAVATKINSGIVTVSKNDKEWTISWGSKYPQEYVFTGEVPTLTKPDKPSGPVTVEYTYVMGEPKDCILNDNTTVVEGVHKNPVIISDAGGNVVAYLELVMADGDTEIEGEYVSTEYAHEAGQLANGYFMDLSAYGWGIIEGGSWYMNGDTKVYIDPNIVVTVEKLAKGAYRFSSNGFDLAAAGPDYDGGGDNPGGGGESGDHVTLTKFCTLVNYYEQYAAYGMEVHLIGIELATDGVTVTPGGWGNTYGGDGNYIKLEFYTAAGEIAPGTYKACAVGGEQGPGEFGIGYDGQWGASGTTWYTLTGGQSSYKYVTDGTVTIAENGGEYTITIDSSTVKAKYVGKLQ